MEVRAANTVLIHTELTPTSKVSGEWQGAVLTKVRVLHKKRKAVSYYTREFLAQNNEQCKAIKDDEKQCDAGDWRSQLQPRGPASASRLELLHLPNESLKIPASPLGFGVKMACYLVLQRQNAIAIPLA